MPTPSGKNARVCIVQPNLDEVSETFLLAHSREIPCVTGVVHFKQSVPYLGKSPVLSQYFAARLVRKLRRLFDRADWDREVEQGIATAIRRTNANVVLAEYGTTAVRIRATCERLGIPFVAHFHGFDASDRRILADFKSSYVQMFKAATAVIAVSRTMAATLIALGCDASKVVYSPCGVNAADFRDAAPATSKRIFVAVGRFTDKKGPHLTVLAFAKVLNQLPDAQLRFIGDGQLYGSCRDLASALGIEHAIDFLGAQPSRVVQQEMKNARAFIQHSVIAFSGDSEGTPVAVLEAGAMGLPVVATRHAGIPDVVVEDETGLLVDERDVDGMAQHMIRLATDPQLAARLGQQARCRIEEKYSMEKSISRLHRVLQAAAWRQSIPEVRQQIEAELS